MGTLTANSADVNTTLTAALYGYTLLIDRVVRFYGWEAETLTERIQTARHLARQIAKATAVQSERATPTPNRAERRAAERAGKRKGRD